MDANRHATTCAGFRWSGRTDKGPVRSNNEDAFVGLQFDGREVYHLGSVGECGPSAMDYVFAVSDGMGGAKAGEHASRIAMQKTMALLPREYRNSAAGLKVGFSDVLEELFAQVHDALKYLGNSYDECTGMEATLSLCWFTPGWMYFGHIGDSRIYFLPGEPGPIKQLTEDDTHVGWLLRNGKITEHEARTHPRRNVLQKALGGGNQFVTPQVGAVGYEPGDTFLLCTDGLYEGLHSSALEELLRQPESSSPTPTAASRLVTESLAQYGRDNSTALVIRVV
ncbi:MAG TPA: protein phosphatase 2C domain-containing protein [Verrucomicrobiae bacterium]|jgi:protein phosphatase